MCWGKRGSRWETPKEEGMQGNRRKVLERLVYYMPKHWQFYSNLCLVGHWQVENVS